jgi:putative sterol carrier protein
MIEAMPAAFDVEKAGNAKALIQFNLTGEGGGQWALDIAGGQCEVRQGLVPTPDLTVTMDANDFVALYQNRLDPIQAFMGGKIKVSGNVGMMMQLLQWFRRG